jgi:hypothetical protein
MNSDLLKPLKICFKVLKVLGMWQDGNQTWIYFFLGYFLHILTIYSPLPGIMIFVSRTTKLSDFTDSFGLLILSFMMATRCINFLIKINSIVKILETLNDLMEFSFDSKLKDRTEIKKKVSFAFKVNKILCFMASLNCINGNLTAFMTHQLPYCQG